MTVGYLGAANSSTTPSPKKMFCNWSWAIHGIKFMFAKYLCLAHPGEGKTFFLGRDFSNQPDNFSLLEDNAWTRNNPTPMIPQAFHTDQTLWVIFWTPQHLVSVNWLPCRREEGWSPKPCCQLKDSQICLGSWMCSWECGSSGSPSSAWQSYLGAADPQRLPGFLPVILATRHSSRGI